MQNDQPDGSNVASSRLASEQILEAVERLKSASTLIGRLISAELAGTNDSGTLETLYSAKGAVTCAIEEAQQLASVRRLRPQSRSQVD